MKIRKQSKKIEQYGKKNLKRSSYPSKNIGQFHKSTKKISPNQIGKLHMGHPVLSPETHCVKTQIFIFISEVGYFCQYIWCKGGEDEEALV
jgi:hypothetical protein